VQALQTLAAVDGPGVVGDGRKVPGVGAV
jgi:hypothetical protein